MRKPTRYVAGLAAIILGAGALASCKENPPTTFASTSAGSVGDSADALELVDVTADGQADVVAATPAGLVVRPGAAGSFGPAVVHPYPSFGDTRSIAHGDLDGDGHVEVVAARYDQIHRWEEDDGALTALPSLTLTHGASVVEVGDVSGDGRVDLVVLGSSSDVVTVYVQDAAGALAPPLSYPVDVGGYNDLEIGDVDGDRDLDVVVMSGQLYATPDLQVLVQQPNGVLSVRGQWSIAGGNILASGVAVGNVDADPTGEIVVSHGGNGSSAKVTVFEADPSGALTEGITIPVKDIPRPVELADLNGDGHDDAVIGHSGWSTVSVIYSSHAGLITPVQELEVASGSMWPDGLATADVDGDGDLDIGSVTSSGSVRLLRNTGVPTPPATTSTTTTTTTSTTSTTTTSSTTTTTAPVTTTTLVQEPVGQVEAIATGTNVGCAVMTDATAACWGWNTYGQLGDGTTINRSTPVEVAGLEGVTDISVGYLFTCALRAVGSVSCWGNNSYGQLGDATTTSSSTPRTVSGIDDAVAVSAGFRHACAVRSSGAVACWGENEDGQLGDGTTVDRRSPGPVAGIDDATAVAAGGSHACALSSGGTVSCWGADDYGVLGNGSDPASPTPVPVAGIADATTLSGGHYTVCVAREDGTASCWGMNNARQVGDGSATHRSSPATVVGLTDVTDVWAGHQHACATGGDGTSYCWGANSSGQLGDGTTTLRPAPTAIPGVQVAQVRPTNNHTCALTGAGNVLCWGDGGAGALGTGDENDRLLPTAVLFDE